MVLNGCFKIVTLNDEILSAIGIEAFRVDSATGTETSLKVENDIFSYQFVPGDKTFIRIENNSENFHFKTPHDHRLEFPAIAGNYSVHLQPTANTKHNVELHKCTIVVEDYLGRNLLSENHNYLITDLALNQAILSQDKLDRMIDNEMSILIDPLIQNYISFSWINGMGHWSLKSFMIFPGKQIITVK